MCISCVDCALRCGVTGGTWVQAIRRGTYTVPPESLLAREPAAAALLGALLEPRPAFRLRSAAEVAAHAIFAGVDWGAVAAGELTPPSRAAPPRPREGGARAHSGSPDEAQVVCRLPQAVRSAC
jgi:hypothetical protein